MSRCNFFLVYLKGPQCSNKEDIGKTKKAGQDLKLWTLRPGGPHHIGDKIQKK